MNLRGDCSFGAATLNKDAPFALERPIVVDGLGEFLPELGRRIALVVEELLRRQREVVRDLGGFEVGVVEVGGGALAVLDRLRQVQIPAGKDNEMR